MGSVEDNPKFKGKRNSGTAKIGIGRSIISLILLAGNVANLQRSPQRFSANGTGGGESNFKGS